MRGLDGLGHIGIHTRLQATLAIAVHGVGGHGDNRQPVPARVQAHDSRGFQTVQHGHLNVHEDHIVGLIRRSQAGVEFRQRLPAVAGDVDAVALFAQNREHHFLIHQIVFDQEHAHVRGRDLLHRDAGLRRRGRRGGFGHWRPGQGDDEGASFSYLTLHADVAALHLNQPFGDGQAQSGTAVLAGNAAVGLREFFKDRR